MLQAIERAERRGAIAPEEAAEFRGAAERVDASFFPRLDAWLRIRQGAVIYEAPQGQRLVPPAGLPSVVTCMASEEGALRCRDLARANSVPIGAPVYAMEATSDWRAVPAPARDGGDPLLAALWGRDLSPEELTLISFLLIPVA